MVDPIERATANPDLDGGARRLRQWLADHGHDTAEVVAFAASTHSVAEATDIVGAAHDAFVKSIVMVGPGDALVVAVVPGDQRASTRRVATAMGWQERPRLATPDEMLSRTGYPAGGTPPLGFDATFLVDERVAARADVWAGGGSPRALLHIRVETIVAAAVALGGRVARVRK